MASNVVMVSDLDDVEMESPISTIGKFESASLIINSGVVNARTGFESAICFAISELVLSGFAVVIIAPRDKIERQIIGKKMELGARMRMTWPLRIPMPESDVATDSTAFQRSENVRRRPVAASMRAVLPWWA